MQFNYKEQLADSRWLQKKAEILIRDNYTCQKCGAKSHLNVHHLVYEDGRLAWEYPNEKLITLCEQCHAMEHKATIPYFGEVYMHHHSDYIDFMLCYGINKNKKEVYLLGVDNGGCYETPIFECVAYDYFCENYIKLNGFWDKCFSEDCYWQDILIKILVRIYEGRFCKYEVRNFVYPDTSVCQFVKSKVVSLVNSNEMLYAKFNVLLNEY